MADKTSIFNAALIWVGGDTVSTWEEDGVEAALLRGRWDQVLDATLRAHPWNCARARKSLPALGTSPDFEYARQFLLPADPFCLRIINLYDCDEPFVVEGRHVLTDAPAPLKIRYIFRQTNIGLMDPLLIEALGLHLAYAIAYKQSDSVSLEERLQKNYTETLRLARNIDGQEGTAQDVFESEILMVRG